MDEGNKRNGKENQFGGHIEITRVRVKRERRTDSRLRSQNKLPWRLNQHCDSETGNMNVVRVG